MTTVTVKFRGEEREVVVDAYVADPDTNALVCEWHFDGITPAEHEALIVTVDEDRWITNQIEAVMWDRGADG